MMSTTLQQSRPKQKTAFVDHGSGEVLVLIHGVGLCSDAWEPQIEVLSQTHRVITVDMPGHGESASLKNGAKLPDYVNWMAQFITDLDKGPVNIAGHSMGALIAGGLAATRPDLVKRAAMLNPVFNRTPSARAAVVNRAKQIAAGKIDTQTPLSRWFDDTPNDRIARDKTETWLNQVDRDGYATAYAAFADGDAIYAEVYPKIACPFLALTGDGDANSTPEMAHEICGLVQNGHAEIIIGHRHMVNLTAPNQVTNALIHWLNRPLSKQET